MAAMAAIYAAEKRWQETAEAAHGAHGCSLPVQNT